MCPPATYRFLLSAVVWSVATYSLNVAAIDCYVCSSINGTNQYCEDTFNTNYPEINYLQTNCMAYRKGRNGFFPADHCIKISGVSTSNVNMTIMIRTCAMDSGSLTADTEIVRMSHCGHFVLDNVYYSGCVQTCKADGCNKAYGPLRIQVVHILVTSIALQAVSHGLIRSADISH